jgi:hypothetical protein
VTGLTRKSCSTKNERNNKIKRILYYYFYGFTTNKIGTRHSSHPSQAVKQAWRIPFDLLLINLSLSSKAGSTSVMVFQPALQVSCNIAFRHCIQRIYFNLLYNLIICNDTGIEPQAQKYFNLL